jgi:polyisoprenyl-phosphate glycosyltransferase
MKNKYKATIIIPAYNEQENIRATLDALVANAEAEGFEVIVVDDGSIDKTKDTVEQFPNVRLINHGKNKGKFEAMKTGVEASQTDLIVFIDADLEGIKPAHVHKLVYPVDQDNVDMTIAFYSGSSFLYKYIGFGEPMLCGARCIKKGLFHKIIQDKILHGYEIEMLLNKYFLDHKLNYRIVLLDGVKPVTQEKKKGQIAGKIHIIKMLSRLIGFYGPYEFVRQIVNISIMYQLSNLKLALKNIFHTKVK